MKKQLLLFAFSAMALTSCEDDDIQGYELDMMKGDWKTAKTEVISGKDNKTVINTSIPSGCSAKNNTYFRTDYYTSYTAYTGAGADCQVNGTSEGTFTYDTETKNLNIKYNNDTERPYKVVILTSTELKVMELFDAIDQDGDLIKDNVYITYKR
ncbi:Lipocalin-like domain-containing protein [Chryseobacterium soldanellicola]|uniref:Lipocalin-like domain-containing protein n=1 Tax=Chryseobacterium soldanellicola TaxID=311333 RepID=A0A1H0XP70_9FLAO|nr:lipocalin family protein [Chryseobacterium soldanellicola]SDQ04710.1 Lipocalin-like domain-containing protein [Chryseobacterium soldanellicola]